MNQQPISHQIFEQNTFLQTKNGTQITLLNTNQHLNYQTMLFRTREAQIKNFLLQNRSFLQAYMRNNQDEYNPKQKNQETKTESFTKNPTLKQEVLTKSENFKMDDLAKSENHDLKSERTLKSEGLENSDQEESLIRNNSEDHSNFYAFSSCGIEKNESPKMKVYTKYENAKIEEINKSASYYFQTERGINSKGLEPSAQSAASIQNKREQQLNLDAFFSSELGKILNFILSNMGKTSETEIQNFRSLYQEHPILLQIFDKLVMKYYSAKKNKEDIIRYILRRTFKTIKANIMINEKVGPQKASLLLCERYFQVNITETKDQPVDAKKEALLEFFTPGQKTCKTINMDFVKEVFSSESFCQEYQKFLAAFHNILSFDNNKKKTKFLRFLIDCVKKDCIWKIGKYNRLPWLGVWMDDTKSIASKLMSKKSIYKWKKMKM